MGFAKHAKAVSLYPEEGYIAYTLTGTRSDDTPFAEKDSLTGVRFGATIKTIENSRRSYFTRYRKDDAFIYSSLSVSGDSVLSNISDANLDIIYTKVLPGDQLFYFEAEASLTSSFGEDLRTISDLVWGRQNGRLSAKFACTGSNNTSGNQATISGSFDVAVQEVVNRP